MNALFRYYQYHPLLAWLVCYLNDQALAMDTVSALVELGSASAATSFCALISLSLSSTCNCYCCVCLCSFAILYKYQCSVSDPSCNLVKCYQRENKHIIIIIITIIIIIIIIIIVIVSTSYPVNSARIKSSGVRQPHTPILPRHATT